MTVSHISRDRTGRLEHGSVGQGWPKKEKRWRSENTKEACDLPEILTGSLFKDWRGRVWKYQMSVIWYVSTNRMFKSKCGDTDPYRCHHVRRPKHVAHQRRYWWSRTLFASEWVRHWCAMLPRAGLLATERIALEWHRPILFFLYSCWRLYVYMYTYKREYIIIYTHVHLLTCLYVILFIHLHV
jgi:hypothetical protein